MQNRKLVALSASTGRPSKTTALTEAIAAATAAGAPGWQVEACDLAGLGAMLGAATGRAGAPPELDRLWSAVETCDALVVGSPVYKASYTGLLKHFFDFLDMKALAGRPVVVAATAKAPAHALMIDHQFRPLFAFFGAIVMPTGVFATEGDFGPDGAPGPSLAARISRAAEELNRFTPARAPS